MNLGKHVLSISNWEEGVSLIQLDYYLCKFNYGSGQPPFVLGCLHATYCSL